MWCGVDEEADKIPSGRHGNGLGKYLRLEFTLPSLADLGIDDSAYQHGALSHVSPLNFMTLTVLHLEIHASHKLIPCTSICTPGS